MRVETHSDVVPNSFTFAGVFTAAALLLDHSGGKQAHAIAVKTLTSMDVFIGSSLVSMYCKLGLVVDARKVFDAMPERNPFSWAAMVSGYAFGKRAVEAFELFNLMRGEEEEVGVNEFVVTSVLSAVSLPEFVLCGKQIHGLAEKNGLLCFVAVGNSLVTMYAKCERLADALQMFELSSDKNSIDHDSDSSSSSSSSSSTPPCSSFSSFFFFRFFFKGFIFFL